MPSEAAPSIPSAKTVRDTGKELPQGELRSLLKQMKKKNRRQSLNKHHLWINRKAQLDHQVRLSASRLGSPPSEDIIVKQILLLILQSGSWRVLAMKICKCFQWNAWCIINHAQQALWINNTFTNQKAAQSYDPGETRQENHLGMKMQHCLYCFFIMMVRKHSYNSFCSSFL